MKALLLIDLQNDFMPGGARPVPKGDEVASIANLLQPCFKLVVATQQWRPPNHVSFAASHRGMAPGEVLALKGRKITLERPYCVKNTPGARLHGGLQLHRINKIVYHATDPDVESYSGFFDEGHRNATDLADYLREKRVDGLYVMGLATDHGVKHTVQDACAFGFKTVLIEDACRGANLNDVERAVAEMKRAGTNLTKSSHILEAWKSGAAW